MKYIFIFLVLTMTLNTVKAETSDSIEFELETYPNTWNWIYFPTGIYDIQGTVHHKNLDSLAGVNGFTNFTLSLAVRQNYQGDWMSSTMQSSPTSDTTTLFSGDFSPIDIFTVSDWSNFEVAIAFILFNGNGDNETYLTNWVEVQNPVLVTNLTENEKSNLAIYPNPATNLVTIQDPREATATITNMLGQVVRTVPTNQPVDISDFKKGMYIINRNQKLLLIE